MVVVVVLLVGKAQAKQRWPTKLAEGKKSIGKKGGDGVSIKLCQKGDARLLPPFPWSSRARADVCARAQECVGFWITEHKACARPRACVCVWFGVAVLLKRLVFATLKSVARSVRRVRNWHFNRDALGLSSELLVLVLPTGGS